MNNKYIDCSINDLRRMLKDSDDVNEIKKLSSKLTERIASRNEFKDAIVNEPSFRLSCALNNRLGLLNQTFPTMKEMVFDGDVKHVFDTMGVITTRVSKNCSNELKEAFNNFNNTIKDEDI